jgi:hypothetical protein
LLAAGEGAGLGGAGGAVVAAGAGLDAAEGDAAARGAVAGDRSLAGDDDAGLLPHELAIAPMIASTAMTITHFVTLFVRRTVRLLTPGSVLGLVRAGSRPM